ncbi:MAG TPA: hypothetical protein VE010_16675 [Thermoanaerobaculia bacterium]|nr:hypothetical protein [Thermoanaerobaculia bacterium]
MFLLSLLVTGGVLRADNFCMDCLQSQVQRTRPDGSIYYQSNGDCCTAPCAGYAGYAVKDADVGAGCSTALGDGEFIVGDFCNSATWDQGCPEPEEPLPPVQPKQPAYNDPGRDPDDGRDSPIIIDIGGNGYSLTSVTAGVRFDIRNDGAPVQVAWTRLGVENAFLALDRNGNGRIDSGAELFGNYTPLRSGAVAANGYDALAELDASGDGAVDVSDSAWADLLLWTDRNHDGMSSPDELQAIGDSIVNRVDTTYRRVGRKDQWGNEFRYMSHIGLRTGSAEPRRTYYDVFLRVAQ